MMMITMVTFFMCQKKYKLAKGKNPSTNGGHTNDKLNVLHNLVKRKVISPWHKICKNVKTDSLQFFLNHLPKI